MQKTKTKVEGKLKEQAVTQWDMRQILRDKAKQSGYYNPETRTFNPTDENIKTQIDYQYKAQFVPLEVLDEARAELRGMLLYHQDMMRVDYTAVYEEWVKRWFGE